MVNVIVIHKYSKNIFYRREFRYIEQGKKQIYATVKSFSNRIFLDLASQVHDRKFSHWIMLRIMLLKKLFKKIIEKLILLSRLIDD